MPESEIPVSLSLFKWVTGGIMAFLVVWIGITINAFDRLENRIDKRVSVLEQRIRALEIERAGTLEGFGLIRTPGPR